MLIHILVQVAHPNTNPNPNGNPKANLHLDQFDLIQADSCPKFHNLQRAVVIS